jgi:heme/copper-type cytochrome/quinol oxidase subunit 2
MYKIGLVLTGIWLVFLIYAFSTFQEIDLLIAYFALAIGAYTLGVYFLIVWCIVRYRISGKKISGPVLLAALWLCLPLWILGYSYVEREVKEFVREQRTPSQEIITQSIQNAEEYSYDGMVDLQGDLFKYDADDKHLKVNVHIDRIQFVDFYKEMRQEMMYESLERNLQGEAQKEFIDEHSSREVDGTLNRFFSLIHDNIWWKTDMPDKITIIGYVGDTQIYQSSTLHRHMQPNKVNYQVIVKSDQIQLKFSYNGRWNELILTE